MSHCGTCNKGFSAHPVNVLCVDCDRSFHGKCANMSKADIDYLSSESLSWRCQVCLIERRKSMKLEATSSSGSVTLEDIMRELKDIKETQKKNTLEFNASIEHVYSKIDDAMKIVAEEAARTASCLEKIEKIENENKSLKSRNEQLEARLEEEEQYSRVNCVELHGIPVHHNENVLQLVKQVGSAVGFEVGDESIDNCHRLGKQLRDRPPPGIIVKFVRRIDKEEFLRKKRQQKSLSTKDIGLAADYPVYVNESLCPSRRKLYAQARQIKKSKHYKYIWLRGGTILMRKNDGDAVVSVSRPADLEKL